MRYYWGLGRERAETPRQGSRPAEDAVEKGIPMMRFARRFSPLIVVVWLVASGARGQTLDIQANVLMGATDVQVGGTLYDVVFVDGTCIELFDGCDDVTDFVFTDIPSATLAANAIEQLIEGYLPNDLDPALTNGCSSSTRCHIFTPINPHATDLSLVGASPTINIPTVDSEVSGGGVFVENFVPARFPCGGGCGFEDGTWAVWSLSAPPEPVPSSSPIAKLMLALLALLIGAGWLRREQRERG